MIGGVIKDQTTARAQQSPAQPSVASSDSASSTGLAQQSPAHRRFVALAVALVAASLVAGAHVVQSLRSAHALQLEIAFASPKPFQQEVPRTAQLATLRADGSGERIISKRYASGFLDHRTSFRFDITEEETATRWLFSPAQGDALVAVTSISLRRGGEATIVPLERLKPLQQVNILERDGDRVVLQTLAGTAVPLLEVDAQTLAPPRAAPQTGAVLLQASLLFAVVFVAAAAIAHSARTRRTQQSFWRNIPLHLALPLALACALILAMAGWSAFNAHPDEYLHFEAAKYFASHWLPPALNDPALEPSFSHYGFSYLQDLDGSYFLMGKFIAVLGWLSTPEFAARVFNVLLFAAIAVWVMRRLHDSLAAAVLLVSPQVWYVFSYANGDGWPLVVALLVVVQLADEQSSLHRYLRGENWRSAAGGGLLFVGLLVLLLVAKRNYYLFLPFVAAVAFWKTFFWNEPSTRLQLAQRWVLIGLATAAIFFPLRLAQAAINHFDHSHLRQVQAEKFAAPGFKPSDVAAGKGSPALALRKRGAPLMSLFAKYPWPRRSFESFCGVYHWMTLRSSAPYYLVMGALYIALLACAAAAFRRLPGRDVLFGAAVFVLAVAVVLASAYHSWTADYQPQGRYLFPILPMFAFLLHRYRESFPRPALLLLLACLFAGSVFSFVFTGLAEIPK